MLPARPHVGSVPKLLPGNQDRVREDEDAGAMSDQAHRTSIFTLFHFVLLLVCCNLPKIFYCYFYRPLFNQYRLLFFVYQQQVRQQHPTIKA